MDGIQLVPAESQPTVVMPPTVSTQTTVSPARKKSRVGLWVVLALIILVLGGAAIAGLMLYAYRLGSETARVNVNVASTPSPRPGASPAQRQSTPQSSPASAATTEPTPATAPGNTGDAGPDEVTPITWSTSASTFKNDVGLVYRFECPPEGTAGTVWGSELYTADSSICTAAVHAGKITLARGGEVTIEFRAGKQTYGATVRNGITSHNYGQYPRSFSFK